MMKTLTARYLGSLADRVANALPDLVHESASSDPVVKLRHRNFLLTHIVSGVLAMTVLVIYFSLYDIEPTVSSLFYYWFFSPLGIAIYLSRTGRIDIAQFFSALNLAGLAGFAAFLTGGISSPLLLWLLLVPLEAALSMRRVITYSAVIASALTLLVLFICTVNELIPTPLVAAIDKDFFVLFSTMAAIAYAGGLVGTVQLMNRKSSAALNESQESYRFLADNATDLITKHRPDGSVLFASQACEQIVGVAPADLERDGLLGWVHVADRPAYLNAISVSAHQLVTVSEEFRLRRSDAGGLEIDAGEYIWVEMRCRPVLREPGRTRKGLGKATVLAVTRDISLRKAQEIELARAKEHAESANRAKSLFVASISHELRTPLNAIVGFSDILSDQLRKAEIDDKYVEYSDLIRESGQHLSKIVNDILDLSKIEAGKFEISPDSCDLDELISISCETVRPLADQKELSIAHEAASPDGEIICDPRAIQQVLLNLLSNAIKFSAKGESVEVLSERNGDEVLIKVIDHGVGIAADDIENLGRPFVQAENCYSRQFEGTGLGLCVVYGLVGLHGGEIEIESEVGMGTTVIVRLPVNGPPVEAANVVEMCKTDREAGTGAGDNLVQFSRNKRSALAS